MLHRRGARRGMRHPTRTFNVSYTSDNFLFWLIAAAMIALALAFILPRLLARRGPSPGPCRNASNVAIYRSELADLDRQRADRRMTGEQYSVAREELERRLLSETADIALEVAPVAPSRGAAILIVLTLPALALGLYAAFGDPAALEQTPFAETWADAGDPNGFRIDRDVLARHLAHHPRDGRGWVLLARGDFAANRFVDAAAAYERALGVSPKVAADAGIWCEYADALGMTQGGTLAGRPRELVMRALKLDSAHPKALEMAGSAAYELGDFAAAASYWRQLLAQFPEGTAQHRELAVAIGRAEQLTLAASVPAEAPR